MLNDTRPIHPVNVCQRNGFLVRLIDTHVDEADVVIEALAEDDRGHERDDCNQEKPFVSFFSRAVSDLSAKIFHARQECGEFFFPKLTVGQFLLVRDPALGVEGVVLGQVEGDVRVEGADDVLFDVEPVDEAGEYLALDVFGRGVAGAVADVGAGGGVGPGVEAWCREGEEGGDGGEGGEEG